MQIKRLIAYTLGTGGGCGLVPVAPGTAGSLAAALIYAAAHSRVDRYPAFAALAFLVVSLAGVWASREIELATGRQDPRIVVVDEIAGQWLTLAFLPFSWPLLGAGFLLFRLFDIWKPYPIRRLERLPHGWGIMLDDLLAGVYAHLILRLGLALFQKG